MYEHQSVLLKEAVDALVTNPDSKYVDATFGRGGHSRLILSRISGQGKLLVIDKDAEAIGVAADLAEKDPRVVFRQGSFAALSSYLGELGWNGQVQGVLLDLGVSSPQLDDASRGFSFSKDGPLDMRMNQDQGMTAAQWLATAGQDEIADVLYQFGEERHSRRIARAIVAARQQKPLESTLQLAEVVKQANPSWEKHKHPATRAFQGIRIFINSELQELQDALTQVLDALVVGGRLVVISFHSLEDRIVKRFIQRQEKGDDFPAGVPVTQAQMNPRLKRIGKPVRAETVEVEGNLRARSAVMRVAEKIA